MYNICGTVGYVILTNIFFLLKIFFSIASLHPYQLLHLLLYRQHPIHTTHTHTLHLIHSNLTLLFSGNIENPKIPFSKAIAASPFCVPPREGKWTVIYNIISTSPWRQHDLILKFCHALWNLIIDITVHDICVTSPMVWWGHGHCIYTKWPFIPIWCAGGDLSHMHQNYTNSLLYSTITTF